jgi:hypothetical protein
MRNITASRGFNVDTLRTFRAAKQIVPGLRWPEPRNPFGGNVPYRFGGDQKPLIGRKAESPVERGPSPRAPQVPEPKEPGDSMWHSAL